MRTGMKNGFVNHPNNKRAVAGVPIFILLVPLYNQMLRVEARWVVTEVRHLEPIIRTC
jgi:hypothetical protein